MAFDKLIFLYLILGNHEKLGKMAELSRKKMKDWMNRFQSDLLIGDVQDRVKILAEIGQRIVLLIIIFS